MNQKTFYCYVNQGKLEILAREPENFKELPGCIKVNSPNSVIAEMTFNTNFRDPEVSPW